MTHDEEYRNFVERDHGDEVATECEDRAEYDDGEYDDGEIDDFDEYQNCGMMHDGQCTKAGSEECDWECGLLG